MIMVTSTMQTLSSLVQVPDLTAEQASEQAASRHSAAFSAYISQLWMHSKSSAMCLPAKLISYGITVVFFEVLNERVAIVSSKMGYPKKESIIACRGDALRENPFGVQE
jgi:hypothetical protein